MANTIAQYGDVTINVTTTFEFSKESVTDQSDTDVIMSRETIGVRGIISKTPTSGRFAVAGNGAGDDAATTYKAIENTLNKRRRRFVYQDLDSNELIVCEPALSRGGDPNAGKGNVPKFETDVNNGPWCREFKIDRFANNTYHVSARFVLHRRPCRDFSAADANVLSNRWEVEETRDVNWYLSRRIVGHIRFASANMERGAFGRLCYPALPDGFRREQITTAVSLNGLEMVYTIADKQVASAAPWPATDWDASVREELANEMKMLTSVNVKLIGPPDVDRQQLIQTGMAFVLRRVVAGSAKRRMLGITVLDHVSGSDVQITANVLHHTNLESITKTVPRSALSTGVEGLLLGPTAFIYKSATGTLRKTMKVVDHEKAAKAGTEVFSKRLQVAGTPAGSLGEFGPEYRRGRSRTPQPYAAGSAAELFVQWLQDPCSYVNDMPNAFQLRLNGEGKPPKPNARQKQAGRRQEPDTLAATGGQQPHVKRLVTQAATFKLPLDSPKLSRLAEETYFEFGQIESRTSINTHSVLLPVCASYRTSPDAVVVDLARDSTRWLVRARMTRVGAWPPLLRHEVLQDKVMKTLTPIGEAKVHNSAPIPGPDGVLSYTVDSEYEWGAERSPKPGESLRAPSLPWITTTPAGNRLAGGLQAVPGSKGAIA